jgi:hypothetical protein
VAQEDVVLEFAGHNLDSESLTKDSQPKAFPFGMHMPLLIPNADFKPLIFTNLR